MPAGTVMTAPISFDDHYPERGPLARGTAYATGAGTAVGSHQHSHFAWRVIEQGGEYVLDPWILFGAVVMLSPAGISAEA